MDAESHESAETSEVFEGMLDGALFEAYLADLDACAIVRSVQVRGAPGAHAEETQLTLDQARMLLVLGRIRGAQVRYEHQGVAWIDTLSRGDAAVRLVRVRDPVQPRLGRRRLRVVDGP